MENKVLEDDSTMSLITRIVAAPQQMLFAWQRSLNYTLKSVESLWREINLLDLYRHMHLCSCVCVWIYLHIYLFEGQSDRKEKAKIFFTCWFTPKTQQLGLWSQEPGAPSESSTWVGNRNPRSRAISCCLPNALTVSSVRSRMARICISTRVHGVIIPNINFAFYVITPMPGFIFLKEYHSTWS